MNIVGYQRSVTLPAAVDPDKMTATYKDGSGEVGHKKSHK
jgi:HSP20 family molecular chaperone IbpA